MASNISLALTQMYTKKHLGLRTTRGEVPRWKSVAGDLQNIQWSMVPMIGS